MERRVIEGLFGILVPFTFSVSQGIWDLPIQQEIFFKNHVF